MPELTKELKDEELEKVSGGNVVDGVNYMFDLKTWFINANGISKTRIYYIKDYAGSDSYGPLYNVWGWVEKMPGNYGNPTSYTLGESTLNSYTKLSSAPSGVTLP